ncbi:unnamed protein product [Prorocentrum cordatum]|uniref:Uncharacterized protein n=1 Tax=Prorocentrum cordatum TaxID=2364126 RepID=A0ABN9RGR2_9DINO|nr:unnamed protein product [Polarella glacialis]|mmetsp:Transcript_13214/g.37320  ORF Transcript_13214/g.37320 Transcript_13214/m.37320 type:complete len:193 (+) Transcript_13214:102-680(+)
MSWWAALAYLSSLVSPSCAVCEINTGGSCNVSPCKWWRKAQCTIVGEDPNAEDFSFRIFKYSKNCTCPEGTCAKGPFGECVKTGSCPRYTGQSCAVCLATGLWCCGDGQHCSSAGACQCKPGSCFDGTACVRGHDEDLAAMAGEDGGDTLGALAPAVLGALAVSAIGASRRCLAGLEASGQPRLSSPLLGES